MTSAVRNDGDSTVTASYAYTHDAGDNMLSKSEPFLEDFEDGNYTGWSANAGWSASGGIMAESGSAWLQFYRANTDPDFDLRFRYSTSDTTAGLRGGTFLRRVDSSNFLYLDLRTNGAYLSKCEAGVYSTLASNGAATSAAGTWYNVRVLCDGGNCTVWRGTDGGGMEQVLTTSVAPFTSTTNLYFYSAANSSFRYDDIQVVGSSLANTGTTFGYNAGNELTRTTFGGVNTDYAYDAWGRMTSKSRGSYSATYSYGQGDKLTRVASSFPGEGTVTYAYGGDGKRRERDDGTVTKYNWDRGWNVVNEENVSGNLISTIVPRLAQIAGSDSSVGTTYYALADQLRSARAFYGHDKTRLSEDEYAPYGDQYATSGYGPAREFAGLDWDSDSGLYYAPLRFYSPDLAKWLSRDPYGMIDGTNIQNYAKGNPVSYADVSGGISFLVVLLALALWPAVCHDKAIEKGWKEFPSDDKKRHCFVACWYNRCMGLNFMSTTAGMYLWEVVELQIFTDPAESARDLKAGMLGVLSSYSFDSCKNKCRKCPSFKD